MKKTLLLIFIAISISCSSSDDTSPQNKSSINPPSWVLGTWLLEEPNPTAGYSFTNDNFCLIVLQTQSCFKESIKQTNNSGAVTNVKEETTETSYSIEITLGSQIVSYEFKKLSSTQIEWINDPLGDLTETIYVKQN